MRYIKKDFENTIARNRLERPAFRTELVLCIANKKGEYTSERYGHDEVRAQLQLIYHDKCAYCEVENRPVETPM
jgi:hypothetical protein